MSDTVTKKDLDASLKAQTDDISQVITAFAAHMETRFKELEQKLDDKAEQSSLASLQRTIDKFIDRLDEQEIGEAAYQNKLDTITA